MDELFLKLLNMSISAAWVALAVMVLRLFLRKAPKWLWPVLWGCVGLRLVLPVSIESALSLIPSAETVPSEIVYQRTPAIQSGVGVVDSVVNPIVGAAFDPGPGLTSVNPIRIWLFVFSWVWAVGVFALLCYAGFSWLRLRRRVGTAVRLRENIYQSEGAETSFVLGLFRPCIYLPFSLSEGDAELVIAHEQTHIARKDHWIKPVGYLLLCVYWFNPILWAAYVLLCRDIELACDERVVQTLTADQRADYSQALLSCSVDRRIIAACPLAFGEVGVKERVKLVLNYKKPAFWVAAIAVVCCIAAAVCFLTDPPAADANPEGQDAALLDGEPASIESMPEQIKKEIDALLESSYSEPSVSVTVTNDPLPSPTPEPVQTVPLTPETAEQTIASILHSLYYLDAKQRLLFTIPSIFPVSEDGKTKLTITLNATYSSEPGTFSVASLLDWETDWTPGYAYSTVTADPERGELQKIMLRVAYMTEVEENSYQEYAADYVELSAPFTTAPVFTEPSVELTQQGRDVTATYHLHDGERFTFSLTLPEGVTVGRKVDPNENDILPDLVLRDQDGNLAGEWDLYTMATSDEATLAQVDTAKNELPMEIFASVALQNHTYFDGYTVVKHSATSASAVSRWMWQDMLTPGYEGRAAEIPFQAMDCILAYDWAVSSCFVRIRLTDGLFTPEQIAAIAESITIQ